MTSAVDLVRQINEIKGQLSIQDILKPEAWHQRQRLQSLCQKVLVLNLEFALDQKIEQDLWNYAFKMQITSLQALLNDKNPGMSLKVDHHADLEQFLESSIGYYTQLLQEVCDVFRLHPPFRKKHHYYGILQVCYHVCLTELAHRFCTKLKKKEVSILVLAHRIARAEFDIPQVDSFYRGSLVCQQNEKERNSTCYKANFKMPCRASSKYICQYCLVHLGDLARYLQRVPLAESFYQSAAQYAPSNGQPYNQLAILNTSRGEKMAVVFYYVRSIAVKFPFPVAATNLEKMYIKISKDTESLNLVGKVKWSAEDIENAFLGLHALLHVEAGVERCQKMLDQVIKCLTSASLFQLISDHSLIYVMAIGLFALHRIEQTDKCDDMINLTPTERDYVNLRVSFLANYLDVLLTHATRTDVKDPSESRVLPTIKLMLDWLVVADGGKRLRQQPFRAPSIWSNLCKVLNSLQQSGIGSAGHDVDQYDTVPLPEDFELQCFLPLQACHKELDFVTNSARTLSEDLECALRLHRLTALGKLLRDQFPSLHLVDYTVHPKTRKFIFTIHSSSSDSSVKRSMRQNVAMQAIMQKPSSPSVADDTLIPPEPGSLVTNGMWSLWGQQPSSVMQGVSTGRSNKTENGLSSALQPSKLLPAGHQLPIGHGANRSSKTMSPDLTRSSSPSQHASRDAQRTIDSISPTVGVSTFGLTNEVATRPSSSSAIVASSDSIPENSLGSYSLFSHSPWDISISSGSIFASSSQPTAVDAAAPTLGLSAATSGSSGSLIRPSTEQLNLPHQTAWGSTNFGPALHSLWSAEPSPLERLLEQQKLQKPASTGDST